MKPTIIRVAAATLLFLALTPCRAAAQPKEPVVKDAAGKPVPKELLAAYGKFAAAARNGDIAAITALALPSSLPYSLEPRPPAKADLGTEVNIPFLKKGFSAEIFRIQKEGEVCYLIRTGSTALWYVKAADAKWWLYKYLDKPIE